MKPQISETESRELVLDSYVMYIHNQRCQTCGCTERFSQCLEVWLHPTKTKISGFRDLRPVTHALDPSLPVAAIPTPVKLIAMCVTCLPRGRKGEKTPVSIMNSIQWAETLKRKYMAAPKPEPKVARATAPTKSVPTLDQI